VKSLLILAIFLQFLILFNRNSYFNTYSFNPRSFYATICSILCNILFYIRPIFCRAKGRSRSVSPKGKGTKSKSKTAKADKKPSRGRSPTKKSSKDNAKTKKRKASSSRSVENKIQIILKNKLLLFKSILVCELDLYWYCYVKFR
jgi:hypothetical protein